MSDVTYDVTPEMLRGVANSIGIEQGIFGGALRSFKTQARELKSGQGWLDTYNDVIQDVLRATEEAIVAFDALVANLGGRVKSLDTTAGNYEQARAAALRRYAGLGGGG